ncbi:phage holin [Geomicrobium sp. JSM 1781026]|uniref:phage holin n=1 Tax=Geomicrobium sp. JSM 1781026 TaxID=3344580 RepID=UPI0035BF5EA8
MLELLQASILDWVLTILGVFVTSVLAYFTPRVKRMLKIIADRDNLSIISSLSHCAVEWVEEEYSGETGARKFEEATSYAAKLIEQYKIPVSDELIRVQIQHGWQQMQQKHRVHEKGDLEGVEV